MIELTVELQDRPEAVLRRVNALARPRRGGLQSPRNRLRHHDTDPGKPFWGHWEGGRFALQPQALSRWFRWHLWLPGFEGEVQPSAKGSRLWLRASFGLHATMVYSCALIVLALSGFHWLLQSQLAACIPLGLAVALVAALHAQLRSALRRLAAQLGA